MESGPDRYAQQVDQITSQVNKKLHTKQLFTSEAPFSDFIAQRMNEGDYQCAAVAIAYFLDENLTNFDLALATGLQKVLDGERGAYGKAESETQSLFNLREAWDEELTRQTGQADQSQERLDTLTGRADKLLEGQRKRFEDNVGEYEQELSGAIEKARKDLEALPQTYDDKLALQAPVRYWKLQEQYHRKKMILFAVATGLSGIIAIVGLVLFALYGSLK